jgi:tyrosine-protein phosphatase YwqE
LLVELPKWVSGGLASLDNILYSLQLEGYMPILAHPERIKDFAASEEQLSLWVIRNASAFGQRQFACFTSESDGRAARTAAEAACDR